MSTLHIEAIRKRLEAATPGPWINRPYGVIQRVPSAPEDGYIVLWDDEARSKGLGTENFDLIANAPEDIAFLLAEVERLRELGVEHIRDHCIRLNEECGKTKRLEAKLTQAEAERIHWPALTLFVVSHVLALGGLYYAIEIQENIFFALPFLMVLASPAHLWPPMFRRDEQ